MYTSSIVSKYGDTENVKKDVKTLNEILQRQGNSLLLDVVAEHAGETANKFKMLPSDRFMLMISLVGELKESLKERL